MAKHRVMTIMIVRTVIIIVAKLRERAGSNFLVSAACAFASWTRTNMTARQRVQYAIFLRFAMPLC